MPHQKCWRYFYAALNAVICVMDCRPEVNLIQVPSVCKDTASGLDNIFFCSYRSYMDVQYFKVRFYENGWCSRASSSLSCKRSALKRRDPERFDVL